MKWSWVYQHDRYTIESLDETIATVATGMREHADLIASAPALLEALKSVEWVVGGGPAFCADCGRYRSVGHFKDCKLAAAIREAEGE